MDARVFFDRVGGMMYGAACGDALGSAFEFLESDVIARICGEPYVRTYREAAPGSLLFPRPAGRPTDDTAMALSVAFTLARTEDPSASAFAEGFSHDLDRRTGRFAEMFRHGGPGVATQGALRRLSDGADPSTCGRPNDVIADVQDVAVDLDVAGDRVHDRLAIRTGHDRRFP